MTRRLGLIAFGIVLGALIGGVAWSILRPPPCQPDTPLLTITGHLQAYREPCAVFTWDLADPGYPNHTIRYNAFGFHDEPVTRQKPPNTYRILVLGDSYPQGLQLPREQGFVDLVETALNNQRSATHYEVLNFGIDTIGTDRMLMLYALAGWEFDPDLVLMVTYVGNDIQNNSIELAALRNEGYGDRPFFKLDERGNLRLYHYRGDLPDGNAPALAWMRRARTNQHYTITPPNTPRILSQDPYTLEYPVQLGLYLPEDDRWREAWAISEAVITQAAALAAAQGSDFGLVIIPDRRAVHTEDYLDTLSQHPIVDTFDAAAPVSRTVSIAHDHDIAVLNLLPVLQEAAADGQRVYLREDGHYNEIGHAVTAAAVLEWLAAAGWG